MSVVEEERRKELKDIKDLMETAHGRRIVFRLLKSTGCLDSPFMVDPSAISHYQGMRYVGFKWFEDVMEVAPKKFPVMIMEAKERIAQVRDQLEREKETNHEG